MADGSNITTHGARAGARLTLISGRSIDQTQRGRRLV